MVTDNLTEPTILHHETFERVKTLSTPLTASNATSLTSVDKTISDEDRSTITAATTPTPTKDIFSSKIRHYGQWFKDDMGRTLLIRGVNVCGSSKLPTRPYPGSTHLYDDTFWDHTNVSFVNRPFPLNEARSHFARLKSWGFTMIRLLVPWEALEAKRGCYDEEYIDYLRQLLIIMAEYDIQCFIDPHQDTWSRFCGGSGAPGWTFEIAGLDIKSFKETGAAYVHNTNAIPGDPLPMVWPTNYTKLACCTMFTLFWAGDVFAPKHKFEGQSIQQLLQSSFINAFQHLAQRLQDLDNVIGFEVMNEPAPGYIGLSTLKEFDPIVNLIFGDAPTPLQCFALGDGIPQKVGVYIKSWPFPTKKSHSRVINASKTSAWLGDQTCIWKQHGVWGIRNDKPVLLATDYFSKHPETGNKVDFYQDFYVPFVNTYAKAIQAVKPSLYCFVEPLANEKSPVFTEKDHHHNMIFAPHWYDLNCVFYKKFDGKITHDVQALQNGGNVISATYFGQKGVKRNYTKQIMNIKQSGLDNMGKTPTLFGEVGIPMDINDRYAFKTGDYSQQIRFLDAVIYSLEVNLVNFTLWNYDVNNDHEYGDHWNGENFSIYSSKHKTTPTLENLTNLDPVEDIDLDEGGRVLDAALRPYASKIAGIPETSRFDMHQLQYTLIFRPFDDQYIQETQQLGFDTSNILASQTEIYIPNYHYQDIELDIQVSHGQYEHIPEKQLLYHRFNRDDIEKDQIITIQLKPRTTNKNQAKCIIM
ncbi:glycoside hydrolase superfamily [Halteromyces radiatus]|uniref:glycoside hydrolase superfamily n=1 Tax=Halteromyces radiatus TaxID=101107 RepID=UPI00222118C4|nr:glycoside hydrolase superfamily [Halteromyces radiatus]KAI8076913.1 glycoside hydrolase superfamily [Halteromyces radiatus]